MAALGPKAHFVQQELAVSSHPKCSGKTNKDYFYWDVFTFTLPLRHKTGVLKFTLSLTHKLNIYGSLTHKWVILGFNVSMTYRREHFKVHFVSNVHAGDFQLHFARKGRLNIYVVSDAQAGHLRVTLTLTHL